MFTVQLRSAWCNHDGTNHPAFTDDYPGVSWNDLDGTPVEQISPPAPETELLEATMDGDTLAALQADGRYAVADVAEVPV
jgi:hypothetical protein